MAMLETRYLPADRVRALAVGAHVPPTAYGSALFADISGFTPITERLRQTLGARRGAETLAVHLNRVYTTLITQVERYDGTIISFAGDAITCWFAGDDAPLRATTCAFALRDAMPFVAQITLQDGETASIGLKVSVATGTARRFIVGDPEVQHIDVLAGATIARMASGEHAAERGEVVVDQATVTCLGTAAQVRDWRDADGERFAVLERVVRAPTLPLMVYPSASLDDAALRPWLLPAVVGHFQAGLGEYLTELRPAVALFVRFTGIDYDDDAEAEAKLDRFIRLTQGVVTRYAGSLLQLTIGDKGSYLYATFGAPSAHEDDAARALDAALELRAAAATGGDLAPLQMGISQGMMRTGAYGGETRRTYGVLGDDVNLAARLMARATPGEIVVSDTLTGARLDGFVLEVLPPAQIKGKAHPVGLLRLVARRERTFAARFYTTPLVGRADELAALHAAVQPIFAGRHAGVITLYGEPGLGKSRLTFELKQRLHADTAVTWVIGQADDLSRAPLSVFAYFLRPSFGQRRDQDATANLAAFETAFDSLLPRADAANRADLILYRSYLAGVVGLTIPGSAYATADAKAKIDNGIGALKAWVRAESRRQPLVVQLEDAQWLDADSRRAVQQLTSNMDTVPVALLLTSRYDDDGSVPVTPTIDTVPTHRLDLNRLSDAGVQALAGAILGGAVSERLARVIRERAQGNPFFTEQLALDLKERGGLIQQEAMWDLLPQAEADVPASVNTVLIARLDRLSAQVKAVVQTAAVLGREFDVQLLSHMLRAPERAFIQVAEGEAIWSALDALRYLFRHALLRDAAYQMQVQERLMALHLLAAETIERLYPQDVTQQEVLLQHWHGAGVPAKIVAYTLPVCERLVGITADYPRAERLLQQALALGEPAFRPVLLRLQGDAARLQGQYESAIASYEACILAAHNDVVEQIKAMNGLGMVRMTQGDNVQAALLIEHGLALAQQQHDHEHAASLLMALGSLCFQQGENARAQTHFTESLRLSRELGNVRGVIQALTQASSMAGISGDHTTASTYLEESLALATRMGYRQQMGMILNNLGTTALQQGEYHIARPYYERSLHIRREIGDRHGLGATLGNLAILAHRQGNLVAAQTYAEASLHERRAIGDTRGIANALGIIASTARDRNAFPAAQAYYLEIVAMQRAINDRWGMATTLINLGQGAGFTGDFPEAQAYLAEGLALYRQLQQPLGIAETLSFQGDLAYEQHAHTAARALYAEALTIQRAIHDQRGLPISLLALAALDLQEGALAAAETQVAEALVLMREQSLGELPRALATLALATRKLGHPGARVAALLREAVTLAQVQQERMVTVTLQTWVVTTEVLSAHGRYRTQAELLGQLHTHALSYRTQRDLTQMLTDLRPLLDPSALEAALARGSAWDMDATSAALLEELAQW